MTAHSHLRALPARIACPATLLPLGRAGTRPRARRVIRAVASLLELGAARFAAPLFRFLARCCVLEDPVRAWGYATRKDA
jgi:hypothetical protein